MADRNDASSSMISHGEGTGRVDAAANRDGERAANVVAEFVDAAREAAESLIQEQKQQVAERVSGVAEALRGAAQSLDNSQNRVISRYVGEAADQVESFSRNMGERRWNELLADTEDFARREPTWFVLGAVAAGFLVGRFLWATASGQRHWTGANRESARRETSRAVTAAVASGSGSGSAGMAGHGAGSSGALEAR
jgi:hypothetical protein